MPVDGKMCPLFDIFRAVDFVLVMDVLSFVWKAFIFLVLIVNHKICELHNFGHFSEAGGLIFLQISWDFLIGKSAVFVVLTSLNMSDYKLTFDLVFSCVTSTCCSRNTQSATLTTDRIELR